MSIKYRAGPGLLLAAASVVGVLLAAPAVATADSTGPLSFTVVPVTNTWTGIVDTGNGANGHFTVPAQTLTGTQQLELPAFDSTLGTLTGVELKLTVDGSSAMTVTPTKTLTDLSLTATNAVSIGDPLLGLNYTIGGTAQTVSPAPLATVPATKSWSLTSANTDKTYTNASELALFVGGVTKTFAVTDVVTFVLNWDTATGTRGKLTGTATSSFHITGGSVTYQYAAVPEAGTMLLGGCAIMPILAHRRRARKTA